MNKQTFFKLLKESQLLGPTLSVQEVQGTESILDSTAHWPISWTAYALATAYHETAFTMQPIMERGGFNYFENMYGPTGKNPSRAKAHGNVNPGDGAKYCGRGFVQLTWFSNYKLLGDILGIDLVNFPDRAMEIRVAADILQVGMSKGLFTGKSLENYLPNALATLSQFTNARRIINGTDKAAKIAEYALKFQDLINRSK